MVGIALQPITPLSNQSLAEKSNCKVVIELGESLTGSGHYFYGARNGRRKERSLVSDRHRFINTQGFRQSIDRLIDKLIGGGGWG
jgi:hypothetical protein